MIFRGGEEIYTKRFTHTLFCGIYPDAATTPMSFAY